jgi:cytochrome c biogenesis protein CcmG, thiol:disulfide interchange protein DsbE
VRLLALRIVAAAGVLALAGVLVWHLTHQPKSVVSSLAHHKAVAAPNFTLRRLDGNGSLTLASLRGKAVIVNFWASWCGPCKSETPRLVSFAKQWAGRPVVVVGVDVEDAPESLGRAFAHHYGVPYPLVYDPSGSTVDPWGIGEGTPQTFFIDRRGRIIAHVLGQVTQANLVAGAQRALRL